eukprot:TRINITY_DN10654_c0_g1_i1.p1 TRINITY_DN10654_c0_g1~~TRINITY_DN10654_c0_g1_i1.p1  ORF type:complete len:185 (-),score=37.08 TRINITY_DN10654_c0_g1_i1:3-557(-)
MIRSLLTGNPILQTTRTTLPSFYGVCQIRTAYTSLDRPSARKIAEHPKITKLTPMDKIITPRMMLLKRKEKPLPSEVLVSKFHKSTTVEQVTAFLEQNGLHPQKVELIKKTTTQWMNAYVILPREEVPTALAATKLFFRAGKRTVNLMASRRGKKQEKQTEQLPQSITPTTEQVTDSDTVKSSN